MKRSLVTTADDNYIIPLFVMLESAIKFGNIKDIDLIIVHDKDKLSKTNKQKVIDFFDKKINSISFYTSNKYENFKKEFDILYKNKRNQNNSRWNSSVLLHGFISDAIPEDIDEIVFVETDLIFLKDSNDFFNFKISLPMAAQLDYGSGTQNYHAISPYFNAGVFITSLTYWRNHKVEDIFIQNLKKFKYDDFGIWPQDFLNDFFLNSWHILGSQINVARECIALEQKIHSDRFILEPQNFTFHNDPILVHFLGSPKPFNDEYWDDTKYRWRIQNSHNSIDYKYLDILNYVKEWNNKYDEK